MRIQRIDEVLGGAPKPLMINCESIDFFEFQTLIICAGFEDRSVYLANALLSSSVKNISIILIRYLPEMESNRYAYIKDICNKKKYVFKELVYDRHAPAGFAEILISKIKNSTSAIWIDVSGMARLLIVQLLSLIFQRIDILEKSTIIYCEARIYPPSYDEAIEKLSQNEELSYINISFLSSGIFEIAAVPELATISVGDAPSYLVTFPSFNPAQLAVVMESSPPSKIGLVHGVPPYESLKWRTDIIRKMNQVPEGLLVEDNYLCTRDYSETFDYLTKLYGEVSPFYNLVISPTGSKMQALAVGIFRGFFRDVQIVFPTHKEFTNTEQYTSDVGEVYKLDLLAFAELKKRLNKA